MTTKELIQRLNEERSRAQILVDEVNRRGGQPATAPHPVPVEVGARLEISREPATCAAPLR